MPQFPRTWRIGVVLTAAVGVLAAGCGGSPAPGPDETVPRPFAACTLVNPSASVGQGAATGTPHAALTGQGTATGTPHAALTGQGTATGAPHATPAGQGVTRASAAPKEALPTRAVTLPDLELPCLAGGEPVRLDELRGPLVINLWASWCGPCREELPAFQRLADSGRVPVLGVVTEDSRDRAAWLADELKVSLPGVYDRDGGLKADLGELSLPLTLLVGADGRAALYRGVALTDQTLAQLVEQQFGRA